MLFHTLPDSLLVLLFALLLAMGLDALALLLPPLRRAWGAPGRAIGRMVGWLRNKMNRAHRGEQVLRVRGVMLTFFLLASALAVGLLATKLASMGQGGIIIEILILARVLSPAPLLAATKRLRQALLAGQPVPKMAEIVQPFVRRDALMVDGYAMSRAVLEALAEATNAALFAPILAYLAFGLPGALAVRLFALQAGRWRAPEGPRDFSASARSVWQGLARLPALLAAPSIAIAAGLSPGAHGLAAWMQWVRHITGVDAVGATFGGALGAALGGPRTNLPNAAWHGGPSARPTPQALRVALRLSWLVRGLALVALCVIWSRLAA